MERKTNSMARKAKGPGFTQKSGKSPAFKMIGSSPMRAENLNDWFMRKTGGGDWEKVMRKPRGVATGHGSGGYTDDWGETATTGIDEFDAKVRSAKASRRRDAARRFNPNSQPSDSLSGLSTEDFWSQYSF